MPNQLRKLNLNRVDLVTQGSNPGAHIVLAKAHDLSESVTLEKESTVEKEIKKTEESTEVDAPALDPVSVQKALDEQRAQIEKLMADNAAQAARIEKAEENARVEKEKRERLEFVKAAETDIPNLPGTSEEKGAILHKLHLGLSADDAAAVVKLLKSGDSAQKQLVMGEIGKGAAQTETDGTALSELNAKADDIAKAEPRLSKQQAFKRACEQNPELFDQHRREARRTN